MSKRRIFVFHRSVLLLQVGQGALAQLHALVVAVVLGAAYSVLLTAIIVAPIYIYVIKVTLKITIIEFVKELYRPTLATTLMYFVVIYTSNHFSHENTAIIDITNLLLLILVGFLTYIIAIILLWLLAGKCEGSEQAVLREVRTKLSFGG